jgi:hypothetical protein
MVLHRDSLYLSVYASVSKISHIGGKCITCCGLPFFNIAEVGITGPKWREIKTAVIRNNAHNTCRLNAKRRRIGSVYREGIRNVVRT